MTSDERRVAVNELLARSNNEHGVPAQGCGCAVVGIMFATPRFFVARLWKSFSKKRLLGYRAHSRVQSPQGRFGTKNEILGTVHRGALRHLPLNKLRTLQRAKAAAIGLRFIAVLSPPHEGPLGIRRIFLFCFMFTHNHAWSTLRWSVGAKQYPIAKCTFNFYLSSVALYTRTVDNSIGANILERRRKYTFFAYIGFWRMY